MNTELHTQESSDIWSDWLLNARHGADEEYHRSVLRAVEAIRDRVLDGAALTPGMTLADVGAGEGLIGFGAIARIGRSLGVAFVDISAPLLRHVEALAADRGVREQCCFIHSSAENLSALADHSIDVVATRATLAFVPDKRAAFREFRRVLKPGGRLSLAEPVNQDTALEIAALGKLINTHPHHPDLEFLQLTHRLKAAQFPSTENEISRSPMTNYSERDLVGLARESGFTDIHMELHIDVRRSLPISWEAYLGTSPHPWAPTVGQVLQERFTLKERHRFEQLTRPLVESRLASSTETIAYLIAHQSPA